MGSAISVYVFWEFNTKVLLNFLSENGVRGVQKKISNDGFMDNIIYRNDTINMFREGTISDLKVDYVLPNAQTTEYSRQFFPPNVLDNIVKAYLWVIKSRKTNEIKPIHIPMKLAYKDINDKCYKKIMDVVFDCILDIRHTKYIRCIIYVDSFKEDYIKDLEDFSKIN